MKFTARRERQTGKVSNCSMVRSRLGWLRQRVGQPLGISNTGNTEAGVINGKMGWGSTGFTKDMTVCSQNCKQLGAATVSSVRHSREAEAAGDEVGDR